MANIRFLLRAQKTDKPANISIRIRNGRTTDLRLKTPMLIFPDHWSEKRQEMITHKEVKPEARFRFNENLQDFKGYILKECNTQVLRQTPINKPWLQRLIALYFGNEFHSDYMQLNDYIVQFITDLKTGKRLTQSGMMYKPSSIKNYDAFKVQFDAYQKDQGQILDYHDIDFHFYNSFIGYFVEKNYSSNTIGRLIKHLKTLMRASREDDHHDNREVDKKKFQIIKVATSAIYLNEGEIQKMYEEEFSDQPMLAQARDLFLMGCYTAQRFSDYSRFSPNHITSLDSGLRVLIIHQAKTEAKVVIPIKAELEVLLKRNNYRSPKMAQQKLNELMETVGEKAGITEPVEQVSHKGGKVITEMIPKNELIKSHTARRTGCTNMFLAGIPTLSIMKISGHKSERVFLNYIKVSEEETADNLGELGWFQ